MLISQFEFRKNITRGKNKNRSGSWTMESLLDLDPYLYLRIGSRSNLNLQGLEENYPDSKKTNTS